MEKQNSALKNFFLKVKLLGLRLKVQGRVKLLTIVKEKIIKGRKSGKKTKGDKLRDEKGLKLKNG